MSSRQRRQGRKQTPASEAMDTADVTESLESTDVDWRDSKTAGQCLSHLCLSDHLADITFTFSSHKNVKLPAHKFVLSMRSSVFEAMFHGPLAEVGNTVLIEDINPDTMKVLLRFVYSDDPKLDGNNVLPCLYAAKKYALTGLVKQCSSFLVSHIDSGNVCGIHEQAVFYDMKPLETKCFDYILENASKVLASEGFLEVSHATLHSLLKHDELAEEEVNVFNAAIKWSQANCQSKNITPDAHHMRESLGEALFAIRFPIMPIEDFARVVTPVGLLNSEEQIMLYQYNATGGSTVLNKFPRLERSGKEVTLDFQCKSGRQHSGFRLEIDEQHLDENNRENARNLKIKSVTGTFIKHVRRISLQSKDSITNFRIEGNKILFNDPVEITEDGVLISFDNNYGNTSNNVGSFQGGYQGGFWDDDDDDDDDDNDVYFGIRPGNAKISYTTVIRRQVKDRIIKITRIPYGLETISFIL